MKKAVMGTAVGLLWVCAAWAASQCEILDLQGSARINRATGESVPAAKGDVLTDGDSVETDDGAVLDLSFDGEWNNTVRVEPGTSLKIDAAFPAKLHLDRGGVYAKLKRLPSGSSFEVATPTAVASARGTEYRTTFSADHTDVFNFSDSMVYVYGSTPDGRRDQAPHVLLRARAISISSGNAASAAPRPMTPTEKTAGMKSASGIDQSVGRAVSEGRAAKIPTVAQLEQSAAAEEKPKTQEKEEDWNNLRVDAFSADMVLTGAQGSVTTKFFTSAGKSRMEMTGSVSIVRIDKNVVWVLMPSEKTYIEQSVTPEMAAQAEYGQGGVESRTSLGEENLDGVKTKKYQVVLTTDQQKQTVYQWMAEGVPVPVKMAAVDGSWTVEYRNVQVGPQADGLFEVPEDYKKTDMPKLPQDASALAC